jgi:branched-chain amino acid transport system substrate-binding protein
MRKTVSMLSTLGVCAVGGFLASSAPALAAGPTCPNGPIKLGAISTITGPADFSDAPKAAKAYFDQINAAGGVNGCKIDYKIEDDKGDPQLAAQGARDLIDNDGIVAMVGGASFVDCQANAVTYQRKGVRAVQGVGIDAACFNVPTIAPVNVGPYTLTTAMALYGDSVLKDKNICAFFIIIGGTQEAYAKAIANWEKLSGKKIHLLDMTLPLQGDLTPYVIKARDAGCDAVMTNSIEPGLPQLIKTADAQKITGIDWLFFASVYSAQSAKSIAGTQQPIYVGVEWEPFTDADSPANKDWVASQKQAGLPLTAFSQGGFLSAKIITAVIKTINGPVTRESMTEALTKMKPITDPLSGSPNIFGDAKAHSPMQATKVIKFDPAGVWAVKSTDWFLVPTIK